MKHQQTNKRLILVLCVSLLGTLFGCQSSQPKITSPSGETTTVDAQTEKTTRADLTEMTTVTMPAATTVDLTPGDQVSPDAETGSQSRMDLPFFELEGEEFPKNWKFQQVKELGNFDPQAKERIYPAGAIDQNHLLMVKWMEATGFIQEVLLLDLKTEEMTSLCAVSGVHDLIDIEEVTSSSLRLTVSLQDEGKREERQIDLSPWVPVEDKAESKEKTLWNAQWEASQEESAAPYGSQVQIRRDGKLWQSVPCKSEPLITVKPEGVLLIGDDGRYCEGKWLLGDQIFNLPQEIQGERALGYFWAEDGTLFALTGEAKTFGIGPYINTTKVWRLQQKG